MSTITNEPILLDSTGRAMLDRMDRHNALLSMIAEGKRSEIYSSISQIASIVRGNTLEENQKLFPIGDQIIAPWKDMDDTKHNTDETAWQVPWNIVHHGMVTLESGEIVPGMFLQWHYCTPFGIQFSNYQAFMNCHDGLAAGQYYITLNSSWGNKDAQSGTSWNFTLTQDVPAGGRLSGFEGMPDQLCANWKVKSWAKPTDANPIETVSVASGEAGTFLGHLNIATLSDEGLNGMHQVAYGHNRWKTCALRQFFNKKGTGWWVSQEDFDIRPNEHTRHAFMSGFNDDFLAAVRPVKVTTALNTVEGFTDASEDTYDTFFLASLEQMNAKPQLSGAEGPYFEYWRRRMGLNGFINYSWEAEPNKSTGLLIPAINAQTSPQRVRLRSASRYDGAFSAWYVYSSGCVNNGSALYAARVSPVCVIC